VICVRRDTRELVFFGPESDLPEFRDRRYARKSEMLEPLLGRSVCDMLTGHKIERFNPRI
jgi:hypothetical protein